MDTLLVVGNGYDKYCGLRSSFQDYFDYVIDKKLPQLKGVRGRDIFEKLDEQIYKTFSLWEAVLYSDSNINKMWSDVESSINKILQNRDILHYQVSETESGTLEGTMFDAIYQHDFDYGAIHYNSIRSSELITKITKYYFEMYGFRKNDWSYWETFIKNELHRFENNFAKYLKKEVARKKASYLKKQIKLLEFLSGQTEFSNIQVLNFNYTNLSTAAPEIGEEINVHGSIEDKNIIIGVDYLNYKNTYSGYSYTKTYRKMTQATIKTNNLHLTKKINRIIFFGHSLNDQDYSYFQSIFDYLDIYNNNIVLDFFFSYEHFEEPKLKRAEERMINDVSKLLTKYEQTLFNKDHVRNLLHKLLLENRLHLRQVPSIKKLVRENPN